MKQSPVESWETPLWADQHSERGELTFPRDNFALSNRNAWSVPAASLFKEDINLSYIIEM